MIVKNTLRAATLGRIFEKGRFRPVLINTGREQAAFCLKGRDLDKSIILPVQFSSFIKNGCSYVVQTHVFPLIFIAFLEFIVFCA